MGQSPTRQGWHTRRFRSRVRGWPHRSYCKSNTLISPPLHSLLGKKVNWSSLAESTISVYHLTIVVIGLEPFGSWISACRCGISWYKFSTSTSCPMHHIYYHTIMTSQNHCSSLLSNFQCGSRLQLCHTSRMNFTTNWRSDCYSKIDRSRCSLENYFGVEEVLSHAQYELDLCILNAPAQYLGR